MTKRNNSMNHIDHSTVKPAFKTHLAWTFTHVAPGTFRRNKADFAHHNYPILAPLPPHGSKTRPVEDCASEGPFIYFVHDAAGRLCYIGKSEEACVIQRWVRPATTGANYWTHSTKSGGNVFDIAAGLSRGEGPFTLRYTTLSDLLPMFGSRFGIPSHMLAKDALKKMEAGLTSALSPLWLRKGRRSLATGATG